jgi:hypothetical protein
MILFAFGQARTILVLGLPLKDLILFRDNIFHINKLYYPYPGNMECHNFIIPWFYIRKMSRSPDRVGGL